MKNISELMGIICEFDKGDRYSLHAIGMLGSDKRGELDDVDIRYGANDSVISKHKESSHGLHSEISV